MNRFKTCLALICTATLGAGVAGCGSYTLTTARSSALSRDASIAVSVWADERYQDDLEAFEAHLTAVLVRRGHEVRPVRLEHYTGRQLLERLLPQDSYSVLGMLSSAYVEPEEGGIDTSRAIEVTERNEMDDARSRLEGIVQLAQAIPSSWAVQNILIVHRFDRYGFAAYVVNLENARVTHTMVVSGDQAGFMRALGQPTDGRWTGAADGSPTRLEFMRWAEFVARSL